jgi:RNA polymerase sigma-70 factor (ECF subfamily)
MARAQAGLDNFRGTTEAEFISWLQAALANVLKDRMRKEFADKRDVRREQQLDAAVIHSSVRLNQFIAQDNAESPASAMQREERAVQVAEAVARLDQDQRDAILLREMQGLPVTEIANRLADG